MSTIIDLRYLSPNQPSLCIPRVFNNIDEARIRHVFDSLPSPLGQISNIDMVERKTEKGEPYKRVFVHFDKWNWNSDAQEARRRLISGKDIKIVYDNPWFWKISANRSSPRDAPMERVHEKSAPHLSFDEEDNHGRHCDSRRHGARNSHESRRPELHHSHESRRNEPRQYEERRSNESRRSEPRQYEERRSNESRHNDKRTRNSENSVPKLERKKPSNAEKDEFGRDLTLKPPSPVSNSVGIEQRSQVSSPPRHKKSNYVDMDTPASTPINPQYSVSNNAILPVKKRTIIKKKTAQRKAVEIEEGEIAEGEIAEDEDFNKQVDALYGDL